MRYATDKRTTKQRLLVRREIDTESGCWYLAGRKRTSKDYHCLCMNGKMVLVHRLSAWIWLGFDIKSKLLALHDCDHPPCWNPNHLFFGTNKDNAWDREMKGRHGDGGGKANRNKTHCVRGHPYNKENTYYHPKYGRQCLICHRMLAKIRREK